MATTDAQILLNTSQDLIRDAVDYDTKGDLRRAAKKYEKAQSVLSQLMEISVWDSLGENHKKLVGALYGRTRKRLMTLGSQGYSNVSLGYEIGKPRDSAAPDPIQYKQTHLITPSTVIVPQRPQESLDHGDARSIIREAGINPDTGEELHAKPTITPRKPVRSGENRSQQSFQKTPGPSGISANTAMREKVSDIIVRSTDCQRLTKDDIEGVLGTLIEPSNITADEAWATVIGQEEAKAALRNAVVLPLKRPDVYCGIRAPPSGILLYGPPGNGKTLLARAIATAAGVPFFSLSASSLVSKYLGEGERRLAALFTVARACAPSIVWIDEVDSILTERGDGQHEAMRRLQTEFLVQVDGLVSGNKRDAPRPLVLAATNRPMDLDPAALRRFKRRILIAPPDENDRERILRQMLGSMTPPPLISDQEYKSLALRTDCYSASDLSSVAAAAALLPLNRVDISTVDLNDIPPVSASDVFQAIQDCRPSLSHSQMAELEAWSREFGS